MPRCAAMTKIGKRCSKTCSAEYCYIHTNMPATKVTKFVLEDTPMPEIGTDPIAAVIDNEIEMMKTKIKEMKEELKMLKTIKKSQNTKIQTKAKWLFYHAHKGNESIQEEITKKLVASGLAVAYKNKKEIMIPYMMIKQYTDNVYMQLSEEAKKPYMEEARELLLEAQA